MNKLGHCWGWSGPFLSTCPSHPAIVSWQVPEANLPLMASLANSVDFSLPPVLAAPCSLFGMHSPSVKRMWVCVRALVCAMKPWQLYALFVMPVLSLHPLPGVCHQCRSRPFCGFTHQREEKRERDWSVLGQTVTLSVSGHKKNNEGGNEVYSWQLIKKKISLACFFAFSSWIYRNQLASLFVAQWKSIITCKYPQIKLQVMAQELKSWQP